MTPLITMVLTLQVTSSLTVPTTFRWHVFADSPRRPRGAVPKSNQQRSLFLLFLE